MSRIRELAGYEAIFYNAPEANVSIVARIAGKISEQALKSAIKVVCGNHPLLNIKLVKEADNKVYMMPNKAAHTLFRCIPKTSDYHWQSVIDDENLVPFDFETGPLIRFVLLFSESVSDLLIYCQHTICDGLSLCLLLKEILERTFRPTLDQFEPAIYELPNSSELSEFLHEGWIAKLLKKTVISHMNRKWKKTEIFFSKKDFLDIHTGYYGKFKYYPSLLELDRSQTSSLITACKLNKVTVNSAICVAIAAARQELRPYHQNRVQGIAVSIRRRYKNIDPQAFGCFVGDIGFPFMYDARVGFWKNASEHIQIVKRSLDDFQDLQSVIGLASLDRGLVEAMTFARHLNYVQGGSILKGKLAQLGSGSSHIAVNLARRGMKEYPGLLITNLGVIEIPSIFGDLRLEKIIFAPSAIPLPPGGLIVGAITFDGKLSLSVNSVEERMAKDPKLVSGKILARAIEILLSNF